MAIQYNPYTKQYSDVSAQPDTAGAVKGNTQAATGGTPPANLGGATPYNSGDPYGSTPQVPNPFASQATSITGNLQSLPGLGDLTTQLNTLIAGNASLPYKLNLPNYTPTLNKLTGNALSLSGGQIPDDIMAMLNQQGAERGVSTGAPGSANSNAATLRALGLTGLDLEQKGLQNFQSLVGMTPTGKQFDPTSFLTTPSDVQTPQWLSNLLRGAPDPRAAAQANIGALLAGLGRGGGNTNPLGGLFGSVKPEPVASDPSLPGRTDAYNAAWAPGGAFNPTIPKGGAYPGDGGSGNFGPSAPGTDTSGEYAPWSPSDYNPDDYFGF